MQELTIFRLGDVEGQKIRMWILIASRYILQRLMNSKKVAFPTDS